MHGKITRELINCLDGDFVDTEKFFRIYPLTDSLKQDLAKLESLGYISLDYGDNKILDIGINEKFKELIKADC